MPGIESGPRVLLVTFPGFPFSDPVVGRLLKETEIDTIYSPKTNARHPEELISLARGCVGVIASTDPFTAEVFDRLPDARIVARVGVGYDQIDLDAASHHGVVVTVARGASEETVADHTVGLILAFLRRITSYDRQLREGRWDRTANLGSDLTGKTVGIIGLGAIGQAVARRLRGFDVELVGHDPVNTPSGMACVDLEVLLDQSDIVTVHVPLTAGTVGLVGRSEIARMRKGAVLVNTSRGGVVDESALIEALESGHLSGAALDVFSNEPTIDPRLTRTSATLLTPHIAGLTEESVARMARHAVGSVVDLLEGRTPRGALNWEAVRTLAGHDPHPIDRKERKETPWANSQERR